MDNFKEIEKYLDGTMSSDEKKEFEVTVAEDKKLAAELLFHREINEAILDDEIIGFRQKVKNVIEQEILEVKPLKRSLVNAIKIPLAASVLALVVLSLFRILVHQDLPELYTSYYEPYSTDISTRSIEQSKNNIQLSYYLYQEGNYEASFEILKNYLSGNSEDQTAHFYLGLNALELNRLDLAIEEFLIVEQDTLSPFELHARWYLIMAYIKAGDITHASYFLRQLIGEENMYTAKAKKIIRKLSANV